jgi:hypothetical protein
LEGNGRGITKASEVFFWRGRSTKILTSVMPIAFYFNMVDPSMNSVKQKTFLSGRELLMQLSL